MLRAHRHFLRTGYRFEEYEVVRRLGAGGFGITYLATDQRLDGPVANWDPPARARPWR